MNVTLDELQARIDSTPDSHHVEAVRCHPSQAAAVRRIVGDTVPIFTHGTYAPEDIFLVRRRGPHPGTHPDAVDGTPYP